MGKSARLAAEIPDIFRHGWRRAGKFRNDDGLGVAAVCSEGGCGNGRLTTGERVKESPPNCGHSEIPRPLAPPQKTKPLVLPVHRRHACLAGPPANTCSRNCHQNKRNSASHRHSGIFRRGASRDGKYPESPAPAGRNSMGKQIPPEILSHARERSDTHAATG